jgi:hypothetical protein
MSFSFRCEIIRDVCACEYTMPPRPVSFSGYDDQKRSLSTLSLTVSHPLLQLIVTKGREKLEREKYQTRKGRKPDMDICDYLRPAE